MSICKAQLREHLYCANATNVQSTQCLYYIAIDELFVVIKYLGVHFRTPTRFPNVA